jgi:FHA domain-containing protein/type VI secretion system protein
MQLNNPILLLRVAKFNDEAVAEPIMVEFGPQGGTIGRAIDCTLVLPDQQRAISRVHARIEFRAGAYLLCDLGSNPSVLNERAIGGTREARLAQGDRLLIGTYQLEVSLAERSDQLQALTGGHDPLAAAKVLGGALPDACADPLRLGEPDPLGQPGLGVASRNPGKAGFVGSESDHVSPEFEAFSMPVPAQPAAPASPPVPTPGGSDILGNYDPLADAIMQWETASHAPGAAAAPIPSPFPAAVPFSEPTEFNLPFSASPSGTQPLPPASHAGPTGLPASLLDGPVPGTAATPLDDLLKPDSPAAPLTPPETDARATVPPEQEVTPPSTFERAPSPVRPAPVERSVEPVSASVSASTSRNTPEAVPTRAASSVASAASGRGNPTLAALLDGLGLDPSRTPKLPDEELAHLIGVMLRESLRGTMAVLRSRSMAKREARLDTTLIVARDNNPLKFFPDVDSCLAQMLTGRTAGYLPPAEAFERAFRDIESHELATLAGMRAALAHVLGLFDPVAIEARLKEGGVIEKVLSNRKAKLWDLFIEIQAAIKRESDDDFQRLFGDAFNDAYEAQIDALRAAQDRKRLTPADRN